MIAVSMSRNRVLAAALAAVASLALLAGCAAAGGVCAQCGREECRNLAVTVHLAGGGEVEMCGPRCCLRYLAEEKPDVDRIEVRDFATARQIDARTAVYVEGSDVHPCVMGHEGPPRDERGCCLTAVFDRCLPSAIAFADTATARAFARENGGFLTSFEALEMAAK